MAAIVKGNHASAQGSTSSPPDYDFSFNLTVTSGDDKCVIVALYGYNLTAVTVTVGGNAATLIESTSSGSYDLLTYYCVGVTPGVNQILADFSSSNSYIVMGAVEFSNVDQDNPINVSNEATGSIASSGTASISATTTVDDCYILGFIALDLTGTSVNPNESETEFWDREQTLIAGQGQGKAGSTAGSHSTGWVNTDSFWDIDATARQIIALAPKATIEVSCTAKANIVNISKPVLYDPPDEDSGSTTVTFQWYLPYSKGNIYTRLQVDDTSVAFGSIELEEWSGDGNMEYWNGSSWVTYPTTGVDRQYAGNLARVQVNLPTGGTKYWRVRCFTG